MFVFSAFVKASSDICVSQFKLNLALLRMSVSLGRRWTRPRLEVHRKRRKRHQPVQSCSFPVSENWMEHSPSPELPEEITEL